MSKQRGRLDPGEVKRAIADEAKRDEEAEPFHSPFAAARDQLAKLVPAPRVINGKRSVEERLKERARKPPSEPSELAKVRAAHRAARAALAEAVKPLRRPGAKRGDGDGGSDGSG